MDESYLHTLEFHKIRALLAEHVSFSAGRELALALSPRTDTDQVRTLIAETTEAKALLSTRPDVTLGAAHDVRGIARRASLDAVLPPDELLAVRSTLISARALRTLLLRLEDEYPLLADWAGQLDPLPEVIVEIGRCLDEEGRVLDTASPTLARLRRESQVARDRVVERLRRLIGSHATYLQEPIITERNGRYVVPLKIEFKGRLPGIIHDQSSSGATLFIEPLDTVELNNRWHQLQLEEQREVERILAALSEMVGREREVVQRDVEVLAYLDLVLAKARFSIALKGAPAEMSEARWPTLEPGSGASPDQHPLHLIRARHPLLPADTVVPIDVYAGADYTVLLVTGPNTGGKTVALKTVGLLAAMSQAGLHIPAADGSRLPVFTGIYADIGDEQSIEQSLSTFSSHMTHIVDILHRADSGALVLLDELGAGTDPVEGAALAQAIIATLVERRCLTLCSSHYSQLKVFAFSTPYVQNASVAFDLETLSPTYRLEIGLPGQSNAFAIARRLGLDEAILAAAEQWVAPEDRRADALLAEVKRAREEATAHELEATASESRAKSLEAQLRQRLGEIEGERRELLEAARAEARRELERLRGDVRALRNRLAQHSPETSQVLEEIARLEGEVAPLETPEPPTPEGEAPRVGDTVRVASLGQTGELVSVEGSEAEVRVGSFRLKTRLSALTLVSRPKPSAARETEAVSSPTVESPGIELDLRGWRAEEVSPALDRYLDNAYLAGLPWVHVIHGKGMGVLREVVRQLLATHPLVASYRPGQYGEGGEGVTVVTLHRQRE